MDYTVEGKNGFSPASSLVLWRLRVLDIHAGGSEFQNLSHKVLDDR